MQLSVTLCLAGLALGVLADASSIESSWVSYDFDRPDAVMPLDDALREISGLTMLPDGRIGAVQDEEGILYFLDPASGTVRGWTRFGGQGDFEGVETVNETIFALRSDGVLFEVTGWGANVLSVQARATELDTDNDPEGLAYDAAHHRLLIVCKEDPGSGLDDDVKAIYAFDLTERTLRDETVFMIDLDEVEDALGDDAFKPAALAVHPSSGEIYVLSSNPPAVAVLDAEGRLRYAALLPDKLYGQPEGIAFGEAGQLFIASEGVDGPGMLYRFEPR